MDQAAHSSFLRRPLADEAFETDFDAAALAVSKLSTPATGSAAPPLADPVAGCASSAPLPKNVLVGHLRAAITKIEGHGIEGHGIEGYGIEGYGNGICSGGRRLQADAAWRLGCPAIDRLLPQGLDTGGVHEVKALARDAVRDGRGVSACASAGDWMTGLGFALRLAARRVAMSQTQHHSTAHHSAAHHSAAPWLLWCWPRALASEFGAPSALGLAHLGLDVSRLLIVETARASDALVALEDGLKSSSLSLAFGIFDDVALTPARRLSLAASASTTPCLLITHPSSAPAGATATRWRVARRPSAPHAYDVPREGISKGARLPGNARMFAGLERNRSAPQSVGTGPQLLEWCDETRTFSLASQLASHAPRASAGDGASDGSTGWRRTA